MCAEAKMEPEFDEKLCEEVRRYPHLYNSSVSHFKDFDMCNGSWREISENLGRDEKFCRQKWKFLRDKFVRIKKKLQEKSAAADNSAPLPRIYSLLSWLSDYVKHRDNEPNFLTTRAEDNSSKRSPSETGPGPGPYLPLSTLRLLVPPLRLMSACMWQVAQERNVDQYGKLVDFITLVTEMVPKLLKYKQRSQLILGLRARLILELLKNNKEESKDFQDHLIRFKEMNTNPVCEEDQNEAVELSKITFLELIQILLRDESEKETFFKEAFPIQYGARYDTALQILVWEFFYQLEEFVPIPSFSQVFSTFDFSRLDYKFQQFVADQGDLKTILLYQHEHHKLPESEFSFTSDTILSVLSSKQTLEESRCDFNKKEAQESGCSTEVICDDDDDDDDDDEEEAANSIEQGCGLSPLTSSPCSEAGDASLQSPRCSGSSAEGVTEQLDRSSNKQEGGVTQSGSRGKAEVSFLYSQSLTNHQNIHPSPHPFMCTICPLTYKNCKSLLNHLLKHPNVPPFTCSYCNMTFDCKSSFRVHLRQHVLERPYACSYCDKRFFTTSVLKSHERIHTGHRPYACPLCNKRFIQPYTCTVHLRTHMKNKPYLCSTCGMSFCSSKQLSVHTRTHTGERPYECDTCQKRFAKSSNLALYRRTHTGERPYSCLYCDKSFHCGSSLKKHIRTHTGEKPYRCLTCHKAFAEKSNLKIHLKVHKNL